MFGVRFRSLFTSRWFALLWAVLVILTAINIVGTGKDGPDEAVPTADQQRAIANAF